MKRVLLIILIILITMIAVSCTQEKAAVSYTSWGENLIEDKPLEYTNAVKTAANEMMDIVADLFGNEFFEAAGKQIAASTVIDTLKGLNIKESDAITIFNEFKDLGLDIVVIEDQKKVLRDSYTSSFMTEERKAQFQAEYQVIQQQYIQKVILSKYKDVYLNTFALIGAEALGRLYYKTILNLVDILLNSDLGVFTPEIYRLISKQKDDINKFKTVTENYGEENFITTFSFISSAIYYFIGGDETKYNNFGSTLNFVDSKDIKEICALASERIEKLTFTNEFWEQVFDLLMYMPSFSKSDVRPFQLMDDITLEYLGQNMSSLVQNASVIIKNLNTDIFSYLFTEIYIKDDKYYVDSEIVDYSQYNIANAKKEIAKYQIINNLDEETKQFFKQFFLGLLEKTELVCQNIDITLPEDFYAGISDYTLAEVETKFSKIKEIDIGSVTIENVNEYTLRLTEYNDVKYGYYKSISPLTLYFTTTNIK